MWAASGEADICAVAETACLTDSSLLATTLKIIDA
jgi:hypothetical protein